MKRINDRRGFSLVELIITIAVMSILAGVTVGAVGYINSGKTKKASAKLNSKLTYIQTETMTKKGKSYLYLYKTGDGIFYAITKQDTSGGCVKKSELVSLLASQAGTELCSSSVNVTGTTAAGDTVKLVNLNDTAATGEANFLKFGYDKATGAYSEGCGYAGESGTPSGFCKEVRLNGKQNFAVQLVEKTGKHYVTN